MAVTRVLNGWTYASDIDSEHAAAVANGRAEDPDIELLVIEDVGGAMTADVLWGPIDADQTRIYVEEGGLYDVVEMTRYPVLNSSIPAHTHLVMRLRT